jgi:aryl-alcohol dehydrogenase-like predicted oxidoreductase
MPASNGPTAADAGTVDVGGDLTVNRLGFGAMRVTGRGIWGDPPDRNQARAVLRRAVEQGVNFIDTADSYGPDVSEELIAEALHPYPEDLVIATKGGLVRPGPGQWDPDGRPEHLRQACEGSLRRLRLDQIALYQFHRPDPDVPLEDSIGALVALKEEGKIRHIGLSEVSVAELLEAQRTATIVSVQNLYNLADRSAEPLLDHCEANEIAFIPWFPLAMGELAKPGGVLASLAEETGAAPGQLALAWLLARSPVMLPIPGTSTVAHLEENLAAAALGLTDNQVAALAAAA